LSSCAYFSPFQLSFSILFILFSVLLTVRILTLLGICFKNVNCIFVISVVLELCVSVSFWTILSYFVIVAFGKVFFTAIIMPKFLLKLTRI
jgi:hypothetical protein